MHGRTNEQTINVCYALRRIGCNSTAANFLRSTELKSSCTGDTARKLAFSHSSIEYLYLFFLLLVVGTYNYMSSTDPIIFTTSHTRSLRISVFRASTLSLRCSIEKKKHRCLRNLNKYRHHCWMSYFFFILILASEISKLIFIMWIQNIYIVERGISIQPLT